MKIIASRHLWMTGIVLATVGWHTNVAIAQDNLITINPGFEQGSPAPYHNYGTYTNVITGWDFKEDSYAGNQLNVATGDGTEGMRYFRMNLGGSLETTATARPTVTPGKVYELKFDSRKIRDEKTGSWRGIYAWVDFFDASGARIKEVRGGEFQYSGVTGWQVIKMRATAPPNAARAGVRVYHSVGQLSNDPNQTDVNLRDFRVDNFRLQEVVETRSRVYLRDAPRLLERMKTVSVKFRYTVPGPRRVIVRLTDLAGATVLTQTKDIAGAGRGVETLNFTIPASVPTGTNYKWVARVFNAGAAWSETPLASSEINNIISDDSVTGNGIAYADDPKLIYEGRIVRGGVGSGSFTTMYWPGTQVRVRFTGTKVVFCGEGAVDYLGNPAGMVAIIDGDTTNQIKFTVGTGYREIIIKEGLASGTHTLSLYKNSSIEERVIFKGVKLDVGSGVLRAEPLSERRIEFYGDSVTEGGTPDPRFAGADPGKDGDWSNNVARSYGILTANELGMDARLIAKGGMGIQAGYTPYRLPDKWNRVDGPGTIINDFSTWQPQAVVIAIGHNDQYGGQGGTPNTTEFISRYRAQIQNLRDVYPNAHIFCINTSITELDFTSWEKSVVPLLDAGTDPKLHFQLYPWQGHGGHPRDYDMQAMATGSRRFFSLADWIEDTLIGIGADGGDSKSSGGPSSSDVVGVAPVPLGLTVAIKSLSNNNFVSTDLSLPNSAVRASATGVGNWEQFRVYDAGGGQIGLYSLNTRRYISVDNNRTDKLLRSDWANQVVGSSRVDLQACKLEYSIVSPK